MRTLTRVIMVMAVAIMVFSAPAISAEESVFDCTPFQCN